MNFMEKNYTPVNLEKFQKDNGGDINNFLLIIAVVTTLVLIILLFFLIQKRTKQTQTGWTTPPTPSVTKEITPKVTITEIPSPTQKVASVSPTIEIDNLSPTASATNSPITP